MKLQSKNMSIFFINAIGVFFLIFNFKTHVFAKSNDDLFYRFEDKKIFLVENKSKGIVVDLKTKQSAIMTSIDQLPCSNLWKSVLKFKFEEIKTFCLLENDKWSDLGICGENSLFITKNFSKKQIRKLKRNQCSIINTFRPALQVIDGDSKASIGLSHNLLVGVFDPMQPPSNELLDLLKSFGVIILQSETNPLEISYIIPPEIKSNEDILNFVESLYQRIVLQNPLVKYVDVNKYFVTTP